MQAIYILHGPEHLVGCASRWAALRSVAIIIARGLGLHKLGPHPDDDRVLELNPEQKQAFIEREIGRRMWHTLALLDWYVLQIQLRCSTTIIQHNLAFKNNFPILQIQYLAYYG